MDRKLPSLVKLMKRCVYILVNFDCAAVLSITNWTFDVLQPDTVTGDIVFVLQQKEHPKFKRKGDDLFVEHTLPLTEALCGFQFVLTHLDGRQLLIKSNPGEAVKPGK
jgi:DnaJ-class molecular chaperone